MSVDRPSVTRQGFAKLLSAPGVFTGAFLPVEQAEWRGDRYTLGSAARRTPKDLFVGARLQIADPRNIDRSRERAVQHDLTAVVKSLAILRSRPELAGVTLSREMMVGRDPSGVSRARFGLVNPQNGDFRSDSAAAAECHANICRAIRSAGLSITSAPAFDAAGGLAGLQAWTETLRLRPSRAAAALWWARNAAAVAAIGAALWMIPPVAQGIRDAFQAAWNGCLAAYDHFFPTLGPATQLQASDGEFTDRVQLKWAAVPKATGYTVYRDDMRVPVATVQGGENTSFDDLVIDVGKEGTYGVRATTMFTHGALSDSDTGHRNIEPPQGVKASRGTAADAVEVDWQPVDGAEGYVVLHEAASSRTNTTPVVADEWRDTSAPVGVECRYRVCAKRGIATSRPSDPVAIGYRAARPPSGLNASDGTNADGVEVVWDAVDGAKSYRLSRSEQSSPNATTDPVECRSNSFLDRSAEPGRGYVYRVTAVTPMGGETAPSGADDGWRGFVKPVLKASRGEFTDRVRIEWSAVPGVDGYEISRDDSSTPIATISKQATTSFEDRKATAGQRHSYTVQPVVAGRDAPESDAATGWRAVPSPKRPIASRGFTDRVVVEWEPVDGAERYEVLRDGTTIGKLAAGDKTEYEDKAADIGRLYRYTVASATEETGPGPASKPADGYRNLEKPRKVEVRRESGALSVTWQPVTGATRYEILRSDNQKGPQGFAVGPSWQDDQPAAGPVTYRIRGRTDTVTGPESEPVSSPSAE